MSNVIINIQKPSQSDMYCRIRVSYTANDHSFDIQRIGCNLIINCIYNYVSGPSLKANGTYVTIFKMVNRDIYRKLFADNMDIQGITYQSQFECINDYMIEKCWDSKNLEFKVRIFTPKNVTTGSNLVTGLLSRRILRYQSICIHWFDPAWGLNLNKDPTLASYVKTDGYEFL